MLSHGCRRGWERKLGKFVSDTGRQYKHSYVVMEMNLKEKQDAISFVNLKVAAVVEVLNR